MASEEMQAAVVAIREANALGNSAADAEFDIPAMRASMEQNMMATPLPGDIKRQDREVEGIAQCHIAAPNVRNDRGVLYFHGGGYVMGSLSTHAELMGRVSRSTRAPVLGIDYRLAPEHVFPAAVEDAVAAYQRLLGHGIEPGQIVLAGDSAGGGLVLACLLELKAKDQPMPAGAVLFSPWSDLTGSGASVQSRAALDPMVGDRMLAPMAKMYAQDTQLDHPQVSPLFADLSGLPPLLVQVGDFEILLDDSVRLAQRAQAVGVDVTLQEFNGGYHVFQANPALPESTTALASVGEFFDRVTGS